MNYEAKKFWCDGGCHGNGTERAHAYGSHSDGDEVTTKDFPGLTTNNEAEYAALIWLLEQLGDGAAPTVYTDSRLLIGHLQLGWKLRAANLGPFYGVATMELSRTQAHLVWVNREVLVERVGH